VRRPRFAATLGAALRAFAGLLLFASLFTVWRLPPIANGDYFLIFWGPSLNVDLSLGFPDSEYQDAWERWRVLDLAMTALAAGLLCTTVIRSRALALALMAGNVATALCLLAGGFDFAIPGPYVATFALLLAIVALAPLLRGPRGPTL
jgi:hypothetical protein